MPIYEYVCKACGAESEILQRISDPPAKKCPECGKNALTKEVSAAAFRLKGTGWYETDFKSSNRHHVVESSSSDKTSSDSNKKEDKKADAAKPAKAAAPKGGGSATAGA